MNNSRASVCSGKIRHASRGKAEAAMRSLSKVGLSDIEDMNVYICPFSGKRPHYHVGHIAKGNPKSKYKK